MTRIEWKNDSHVQFDCPGCGLFHVLNIDPDFKPCWSFNGDLERPTIAPSINTWQEGRDGQVRMCCHSFVRDGKIQFLNDCTHALKGQTVDMPEIAS